MYEGCRMYIHGLYVSQKSLTSSRLEPKTSQTTRAAFSQRKASINDESSGLDAKSSVELVLLDRTYLTSAVPDRFFYGSWLQVALKARLHFGLRYTQDNGGGVFSFIVLCHGRMHYDVIHHHDTRERRVSEGSVGLVSREDVRKIVVVDF